MRGFQAGGPKQPLLPTALAHETPPQAALVDDHQKSHFGEFGHSFRSRRRESRHLQIWRCQMVRVETDATGPSSERVRRPAIVDVGSKRWPLFLGRGRDGSRSLVLADTRRSSTRRKRMTTPAHRSVFQGDEVGGLEHPFQDCLAEGPVRNRLVRVLEGEPAHDERRTTLRPFFYVLEKVPADIDGTARARSRRSRRARCGRRDLVLSDGAGTSLS